MPTKRGKKWMARPKIGGKQVYLGTFDTRREAKEAEEEYRVRRSRLPSDVTVKELRDRWLREYGQPRWKWDTYTQYESRTRVFSEQFGSVKACAVTRPEAQTFIASHPGSREALRAMFGYGLDLGLMDVNPFRGGGQRRQVAEIGPGRGALAPAEVYDLADCAQDQTLRALIVFAAFTGLRRGEVLALRWQDLGDGMVWVRQALAPHTGLIDTPKSHKAREVILPPQAVEAVGWVARRVGSDLVFAAPGGGPYRGQAFQRKWGPVREAFHEGLPEGHWLVERRLFCERKRAQEPDPVKRRKMDGGWLKFHELRHTCATMLMEAGVDAADVAEQLGHSDAGELVRRTYGHPSRERALDRVRAGFGQVQRPVLRLTPAKAQINQTGTRDGLR